MARVRTWEQLEAVIAGTLSQLSEERSIWFGAKVGSDTFALDAVARPRTQCNSWVGGIGYAVDRRMPKGHIHFTYDSRGAFVQLTAPGASTALGRLSSVRDIASAAARVAEGNSLCLRIDSHSDLWRGMEGVDANTGLESESLETLRLWGFDEEDDPTYVKRNFEVALEVNGVDVDLVQADSIEDLAAASMFVRGIREKYSEPTSVSLRLEIRKGGGEFFPQGARPFDCGVSIATAEDLQPRGTRGSDSHVLANASSREAIRSLSDSGAPPGRFGLTFIGEVMKQETSQSGSEIWLRCICAPGTVRLSLPNEIRSRYPEAVLSVGSPLSAQVLFDPEAPILEVALLTLPEAPPTWVGSQWIDLAPPRVLEQASPRHVAYQAAAASASADISEVWALTDKLNFRTRGVARPRKERDAAWFDLGSDESFRSWCLASPVRSPHAFARPSYLNGEDGRWKIDRWSVDVDAASLGPIAGLMLYSPWLWEDALLTGTTMRDLRLLEARLGIGRAQEEVENLARGLR